MADKTIVQLLNDVAAQVGAVGKSGRNTQQGYSFRGVDAVVNAAFPALRKHGVLITPNLRSHHYSTVEVGKNRTPMAHVVVEVEYTFHGPAGDTIVCSAPGEAMDSGDKATPKAMSVAYRTALLQALTLPTDEPDPDEDTYERSHPQPEPERSPEEISRLLTNKLKAVALEVCAGDKEKAVALFESVVGDTPIIEDTVDALEEAIVKKGGES